MSAKYELTREEVEMVVSWKGYMDSEFRIFSDPETEDDRLEQRLYEWLEQNG